MNEKSTQTNRFPKRATLYGNDFYENRCLMNSQAEKCYSTQQKQGDSAIYVPHIHMHNNDYGFIVYTCYCKATFI